LVVVAPGAIRFTASVVPGVVVLTEPACLSFACCSRLPGAVRDDPGEVVLSRPPAGAWVEFAGAVAVVPGVVVFTAPGTASPRGAVPAGVGGGGTVRVVAGAWYADAVSTVPVRRAIARTAQHPRM